MIEILPESEGKVLAIRASEKLTDEDYKQIFIPRMDQLITEFGRIRVLFTMADNFKGWEVAAMWDDANFGMKHKDQFEKIAVVGGPKWVEWASKLEGHFMDGAVKTFPADQLQAAKDWISQ